MLAMKLALTSENSLPFYNINVWKSIISTT